MNKNKKAFSKKLLIADYAITAILIIVFFVCVLINGLYTVNLTSQIIEAGMDVSVNSITPPFVLDGFGVFFSAWIAQLGLSSAAYYIMARSEHRIELPMRLINELPQEIKDDVDMTQIITTVLTSADN